MLLIIAQVLPSDFHKFKYYFRSIAWLSAVGNAIYASEDNGNCPQGDDYCGLKQAGITPFLAITFMLGTLTLLQLLLTMLPKLLYRTENAEIRNTGEIVDNDLENNSPSPRP